MASTISLPLADAPERILIIKPSAIGDVVHALPVLNLVRRKWPAARISWIVTPACAGLLDEHPQIDEVIRFDRRGFGAGWRSPRAAAGLFSFMHELRGRRFDLVIDLQGLFRSGWMSFRTRAPARIGFARSAKGREMSWVFHTHRVGIPTPEPHAVERYLCVAEALGCGRSPVQFVFNTSDDDRHAISALLPAEVRFAVMLPGANWVTKRWPARHFAAMVAPLAERFGLQSVVAGAPGDKEIAAEIPGAIDLTGRTNLRQLVALLERASLVIGNDTGPMHIAAALGRPMVTPYGPTDPVLTGPFDRLDTVVRLDIPCSPCFSRTCSHQSCLQWLGADAVIAAAERQMAAR